MNLATEARRRARCSVNGDDAAYWLGVYRGIMLQQASDRLARLDRYTLPREYQLQDRDEQYHARRVAALVNKRPTSVKAGY